MIGISSIGTFVADEKLTILDRKQEFGLNEEFVHEKTGFVQVGRMSEDHETSDLCVAAIEDLIRNSDIELQDIDCLVVVTQNPDRKGIPHTSAIVHGKLDLKDQVAAFDIGLACSGYVYALSIVKSFMEANGLKTGVLVTADPYSKVIDEDDKNTAILFGDGATATLLSEDAKWHLGTAGFGTRGSGNTAITTDADGFLRMNGRAVFTFSASVVPQFMKNLLEQSNTSIDDVDLVLLHQGSRYIVDAISKSLELDADKVPFDAGQIGNTVSSSIPLLLAQVDANKYPRVLISGFGAGLSWASMMLEATPAQEDEQ